MTIRTYSGDSPLDVNGGSDNSMIAVVASPNPGMQDFLRPFVREPLLSSPVDLAAALRECRVKTEVLRQRGVTVYNLADVDPHFNERSQKLPDRVFPEDWGLDAYELYLEAAMTPDQRAPEPEVGLAALARLKLIDLAKKRNVREGHADAKLEVGDRLLFYRDDGTTVLMVAESSRTNVHAAAAIRTIFGQYQSMKHWLVVETAVYADRCLHLTSGSGAIGPWAVVADPTLVHVRPFRKLGIEVVEVDPGDQGHMNCANCLFVPGFPSAILMDDRFPNTIARVQDAVAKYGTMVIPVPNVEHAKGAGGITCRVQRIGKGWLPRGWQPLDWRILV